MTLPYNTVLNPLTEEERKIAAEIVKQLSQIQQLETKKRSADILREKLLSQINILCNKNLLTIIRLAEHYPQIATFCQTNPTLLTSWQQIIMRIFGCAPKPQKKLNFFDLLRGIVYYRAHEEISASDKTASQLCLTKSHTFGYFYATLKMTIKQIPYATSDTQAPQIKFDEIISIPQQATETHPVPAYFLLAITYIKLSNYYGTLLKKLLENTIRGITDKSKTTDDLIRQASLLGKAAQFSFHLGLMYCYVARDIEAVLGPHNESTHNAFLSKKMFSEMNRLFFPNHSPEDACKDTFSSWQNIIGFFKTIPATKKLHNIAYVDQKSEMELQRKAEEITTPIIPAVSQCAL